jgi:hypothetical protein
MSQQSLNAVPEPSEPAWLRAGWPPGATPSGPKRGADPRASLRAPGRADALSEAAGIVEAQAPPSDTEQQAAYRHLLVLVALGLDELLRRGEPDRTRLRAGNVDTVLKWGMDCPDAAYSGAALRCAVTRPTGCMGDGGLSAISGSR